MLLIALFSLFVVFGAVDLTPQRQRQSPIDQTKDLLYTSVVISIYLYLFQRIRFRDNLAVNFVFFLFVDARWRHVIFVSLFVLTVEYKCQNHVRIFFKFKN